MSQPNQMTIRCSSCGQPVPAQVRTVLDAQADPQGKSLLMAGRLNAFPCPHCGHLNQLVTPLLYHDPAKSLLIAYIPMEVSMQSGKPEEKIVGDLLNELTRSIAKENFRSYMFNPKRALTMQGLMEQVMEADGITKDMLDAQKKRVDLIQAMLAVSSEDELAKKITDSDSDIDLAFFQTLSLMAQRVMADGRQDIAGGLVALQEMLLQYSSYGKSVLEQRADQEQTVRDVAEAINRLGEQATRADLIDLAISFGDNDEKLEALVGLVRGAFDAQFFAEFTQKIAQAPASDREKMQQVRDIIQQLSEVVDQQQRATLQESVQFLQALVNSPEQDAMIAENMDLIDNTFMSILASNIQESQRRQDQRAFSILQALYEKIVKVLQSQMSPELRFVNELLSTNTETEMRQHLENNVGQFDQSIFEVVDAVEQVLQQQGQAGAIQRLEVIRQALKAKLN
jgi:predicted RNA-binding Zn-ribbon protein involved in translation (DUF1610 family)